MYDILYEKEMRGGAEKEAKNIMKDREEEEEEEGGKWKEDKES